MIRNSNVKTRFVSILLVFALLISFVSVNQLKSEEIPNYAKDEAKIEDFSSDQRYRMSQMLHGEGSSYFTNGSNIDYIEGVRYKTLEPSYDSEDKTKYGIQIEIDKTKGQRTFTDIGFQFRGQASQVPLKAGEYKAKEVGTHLSEYGYEEVNYKANSLLKIGHVPRFYTVELLMDEVDLSQINSKEKNTTVMAWEGFYTKENTNNPRNQITNQSFFSLGFSINPWPNENDKLGLITLSGKHDQREFVKGQTIQTEVEIHNLDDNAKERVVGQVYHPLTGEAVPGSKAYLNGDGKVVIEMPKGAVGENGEINKDSIFYKDPNYKSLQSLDVKFFARPRTKAEFESVIAKDSENFGTYLSTDAGTAIIKHEGQDVVIDKQGIDRYDHYNLIGSFKLNLDDTRYYDQNFIDGNQEDTSKHTSSKVRPGEEFEVNIFIPEDKKDKEAFPNQKTAEDMEAAKTNKQVVGTLDKSFINKANQGKSESDKWKLEYDENSLPTSFKITPPKTAKPGDFVAIPLTYTYTNGSTDTHWFHFVVQDSVTNKPEYFVQIDLPTVEQKSTPEVPKEENKLSPKSYSIPEGTEFLDDKGNEWTVSINKTTGEITAKPNDPSAFNGGEKLQVAVVVHYEDPDNKEKNVEEETNAEFVIKEKTNLEPKYNAKAGKVGDKLTSKPIVDEDDEYNRKPSRYSLASNKFIDNKGNEWSVSIDEKTGEVTVTVPEGATDSAPKATSLSERMKAEFEEDLKALRDKGIISEDEFNALKNELVEAEEIDVLDDILAEAGYFDNVVESPIERIYAQIEKDLRALKDKGLISEDEFNEFKKQANDADSLDVLDDILGEAGYFDNETSEMEATLLNVPIIAHYEDDDQEVETKQVNAQFLVIGTEGTYESIQDIPFATKLVKIPNLKKGEVKVIKEGKKGSKKVTYTIKDSKIDESKTKEEIIEKPQDFLIHVGEGVNSGTHELQEKVEIPFETVIEFDDNLEPGEQKVETEGKLGEKTRTITLSIEDSKVTKTQIGKFTQTKTPVNRVIKVGRNTDGKIVHEEKIPFKYEISYDKNLKAGEYVVDVEGREGTKTTTWTIKNSKVVGEPEVKETKAVNAVIRVGQKDFTGTFETKKTSPVEFETEYVVDNSLEPGTTKVEQVGELGEEETTVTHTILNGEVKESKEGETVQTKAPVKKIVKVGPAKTEGTHEYTNKIPFEVEIRVNPKLKKGEHNILQKGEAGEEKYTLTIENSVVTETSEPITTKSAKPEIIEIGNEDFTGALEYVDRDPIPFETEVTIDSSLEPNEIVEDQKGELGEQETKITRTITNGESSKEERGETTITKEPVIRKIRIGAKSNGIHTIEEKVEVPFETIVEFDDNLKPGEQIVSQEGDTGEKTRTTTLTIENGEVVNTENSEFTETKTPTNKIIKVGRNTEGEVKHVEELPFGYIVNEVDSLPKGKYEIVKPGKVGTKTTTWTIKNSEITGEAREEIVEAEDAIILVGKGVNNGKHEIEEKVDIPFETIVEFDDNLKPGEQLVEVEGSLGKKVRVTTLTIADGKVTDTQEGDFVQTKDPVNRVVKVGRNTEGKLVHEEKIPFKYEISYDKNLKAGEYVIDVEGVEGTKTTTWAIKNSEVVGELEVKETKPVNAVIRVGQKDFTGSLATKKSKALEFETEYIVDNSLEPGTVEVEQAGSLGEEEITVTHTIVNGEVTSSEEGKAKQTKAPVKRVVKVGPGKTEAEIVYESEEAYEVVIEEDSEMEAGKYEVVQEGIVGKTKTTVKIVNSKEESRDTEIITEKQDKIIKVGTKIICEPCEDNQDEPGQENPNDPETPEKPGNPENPDGPETPENPNDPGTPEEPGNPETPDEPETTENPNNPGTPEDPENENVVLTFVLNGGVWSNNIREARNITAKIGDVVEILEAPTREGYKFLYWKGSRYQPGDKYTVVGNHTFVAQWEKVEVSIDTSAPSGTSGKQNKVAKTGAAASSVILGISIIVGALGVTIISKKREEN